MNRLLLQHVQLVPQGWAQGWLLVEDGQIATLGQGEPPAIADAVVQDGAGLLAVPGFIDVHVHGAVGRDTMDATPEALHDMARFFASHGVTSFLATTMTGSGPDISRALKNAARCTDPVEGGAIILGVHLEGPYLNVTMKGAQDGQYIRRADPAEYQAWLDLNVIRQVTVAPEFAENERFIQDCAARGITVSMGHTAATYEEVRRALTLGARQTTHTFNAMGAVNHRKPGTAGAALTIDELACELIADTIHVHPAILKLVVRAKGPSQVVLITDAIMGAGMPEGDYELGGQAVHVANNTATLADGTLAGSVLTMDRALHNILAATGLPLSEVWPMTSANAARQLGLGSRKGQLAEGYDADIVLLSQDHTVQRTFARGREVYHAS